MAGILRGGGLSIACSLLHVRPSLTDAELDWALPHGELYGFPSRAGVFAAFSMPGENWFRIFGAVPPRPEGPSAKYSEPTHEDFQALLDGVDHVAPFVGRGSGVLDRWTEGRNPMPGSDQASPAVAASRTPR